MKRRIISLVLCLTMVVTLLPMTVWAETESNAVAEDSSDVFMGETDAPTVEHIEDAEVAVDIATGSDIGDALLIESGDYIVNNDADLGNEATQILRATKSAGNHVSEEFFKNETYKNGKYGKKLAEVELDGNTANNIVKVATSQIGYHEGNSAKDFHGESTGSDNYTEYNRWYFNNNTNHQFWCNLFVSWVFHAAGISETIAPKNPFYVRDRNENDWEDCGANIYSWTEYHNNAVIPRPGDVIIYSASTCTLSGKQLTLSTKHIGIIVDYIDGKFTVIEGNYSNKVTELSFTPNPSNGKAHDDDYIYAIIQPVYNQCPHYTDTSYFETVYENGNWFARCKECHEPYVPVYYSEGAGTYKTTADIYLNSAPYKEAQTNKYCTNGTEVTIVGYVINAYRNKWYKTSGDEYIYETYVKQVAATSNLSINNAVYPTGTLTQGQSFGLSGTISSNYTITSVSGKVYDDCKIWLNYSKDWNKTSYNIKKDGMDGALTFGTLPAGSYVYQVSATDASGTSKTLIQSSFTVSGGGGTNTPTVPAKPVVRTDKSTYIVGESVPIYWNAVANNDMYAINVYKDNALIYEAGLYDTSYTITNAAAGSYVIYVSANNAAGTSGVSSCSFTVVGVPETPTVSVTQSQYWVGQSVTVSWNAVANNDMYGISVVKDGATVYEAGLYNTSYTLTSPAEGNYVVYVSANNSAGKSNVSSCSFSVWQAYITYDANGGTGAPKPLAFNVGGEYYLSNDEPTREGYTFVSWRDSYNGQYFKPGDLLPYGWGSDTMVAQWEINSYILDLNGVLGEIPLGNIDGYGTCDVYINGSLVAEGVNDYCSAWPYGTTYEIKNIRISDGYSYDGISTTIYDDNTAGGRTGTITQNTSVRLAFHSCSTGIDETPKEGIFNGHTYYYFKTPVTWYDAKSICEHRGGHLVTITSAEENAFILNLAGDTPYVWLGATDVGTEGTFQWITGEPFTYGTWLSGQPDNYALNAEGAENYLHIYDSAGVWNDNCGCAQMMFVCEIDTAEYSVTYDSNGGNGAMATTTGKYGEVLTLMQNRFNKVGYSFAGWNMKRNSDGRWYTENDSFATDDEIASGLIKRLYANGTDVCFANYNGSDNYTFVAVWKRDFIQGNVNGSGLADVSDMACLFDYLSVGKMSGTYKNDAAYFRAVADVNEDGVINILDYQALYELVKPKT